MAILYGTRYDWDCVRLSPRKDYPENSIPDRKHPHSLQKYFQSKRLIPDCKFSSKWPSFNFAYAFLALEWNQLNTKQQDELILRDKKDRIKKADKKIVSILDELFDVSSIIRVSKRHFTFVGWRWRSWLWFNDKNVTIWK